MRDIVSLVLAFTWELVQTLIAVFVIVYIKIFHKSKSSSYYDGSRGVWYIVHSWNRSFSLGYFIFLEQGETQYVRRHEYGHSIQSRLVGPLYIPLVCIPSFIDYILVDEGKRNWDGYYKKYPEKWANDLAGNITSL